MRYVSPSSLNTRAPFNSLFPIDRSILAAIMASMEDRGYDEAEPVIVWSGDVIDGHTRVQAADQVGIDVAVVDMEFEDDQEALQYAIRRQRDRRNMTDADLLSCIQAIDAAGPGRPKTSPSGEVSGPPTRQDVAKMLGTSTRQVDRARRVNGNEAARDAVLDGKATLAAADKAISSGGPPPRTPTSEKPKDNVGTEIPSDLLPLWRNRNLPTVTANSLQQIKNRLQEAEKEKDPAYAQVGLSQAITSLGDAISRLKNGVFHAVCPMCHGLDGGCKACCNTGLISKHRYERTIP